MKVKYSICNEVFGKNQSLQDWREICRFVKECGYEGIEIAPFTFAENVTEISAAQRSEIKNIAAENELKITGLHWLLVSPPGLHINARDEALRRRTVDYLRGLVHFAGDVGAPVMIFGSPAQRRVEDDTASAWPRTVDSFRAVLPALQERGVVLCQESLPAPECDFILTAAEAQRMVEDVNHPNFGLMLDVKSMSAEEQSPAEIIAEFGARIHHFHANDANRRAPGYGETDFRPIARALRECGYEKYVSLEPFDYWPDPQTLARESLAYLRGVFETAT